MGAKSADICFDGDCTTVKGALAGPDDVFNGFNIDTWEQGRSVELRVTVFEANGGDIDSLTETRTIGLLRKCLRGLVLRLEERSAPPAQLSRTYLPIGAGQARQVAASLAS